MVYKEPVRNEHLESYIAGRFDEIPVHLMDLVRERVEKMGKAPAAPPAEEPAKDDAEVEVDDYDHHGA